MKTYIENNDKIISDLMQESICTPSKDVTAQVFKQIELQKMSHRIELNDTLIDAIKGDALRCYIVVFVIGILAMLFNSGKIEVPVLPLYEVNILLISIVVVSSFVFVVVMLEEMLRYKRQCRRYKIF